MMMFLKQGIMGNEGHYPVDGGCCHAKVAQCYFMYAVFFFFELINLFFMKHIDDT